MASTEKGTEKKVKKKNSVLNKNMISRDTMDFPMLFIILTIGTVGLVTLVSVVRPSEGNRSWIIQTMCFLAGIVAMLLISNLNMSFWTNPYVLLVAAVLTIGACLATRIPGLGTDSARSLDLRLITIQPSELFKVLVILFVAYMYSTPGVEFMNRRNKTIKNKGDKWSDAKKKRHTWNFFQRDIFVVGVVGIVTVALILLCDSHLSATIICIGICAAMMFVGGADRRLMVVLAALVMAAAVVYVAPTVKCTHEVKQIRQEAQQIYEDKSLSSDERQKLYNEKQEQIQQIYENHIGSGNDKDWRHARIVGWLDKDYTNRLQNDNALYAIADGGFFGRGIGNSVMKYNHIPVAASDMIFSVYLNETGVLGFVFFVLMFFVFLVRGIQIATGLNYSKRENGDVRKFNGFAKLVVVGIVSHILIQVILNMFVNLDIFPNTGITLPFFSKGGSALIVTMGEMGLLLSCSRQSTIRKEK